MRQRVIVNWAPSSFHGWGVYGLNLGLAWAADPEIEPIYSMAISPEHLAIDAAARARLAPVLKASAEFQAKLAGYAGKPVTVAAPALLASGGGFAPVRAAHNVALTGQPSLCVTFFETAQLAPEVVERARRFELIVTGSRWNEQVLRAHGVERVRTVLQGIDPTLFRPGPRPNRWPGRFTVFSGGKLERRKGQDLVLAAFARFVRRRPDALLAVAWHSPFPKAAESLSRSEHVGPIGFDAAGQPDIAAWAAANGVPRENLIDLGRTPNHRMPEVLWDMDVALFPNRCEGGTNLVAMEAMAAGVPTILSRNTGHLDLIGGETCYVLERQGPLPGAEAGYGAAPGWGESDLAEIVEALERAYLDRDEARRRGAAGAATLARLDWARTAREMKAIVLDTRR